MKSIIEEYLDEVCSYIKFKEVHDEVKEELRCHIEEFVEEFVHRGMEEEKAVKKAIKAMGGSDIVGERLNKVHKDKIDWISLIIISFLSILGVVSTYFISLSYKSLDQPVDHAMGYMRMNIIDICLGFIILGILYLWDVRKLKKYSFLMFFGTMALVVYVMIFGYLENNMVVLSIGKISLSRFWYLLTMFFLVSTSGIIEIIDWQKKINIVWGYLITLLPVVTLFLLNSKSLAVGYLCIILLLIYNSKIQMRDKIIILMVNIVIILLLFGSDSFYITRVIKEINYRNDPKGYEFMTVQIKNILKDAKLFGNGFPMEWTPFPLMESYFIMVYIIISLGWVGFGAVISIIGLLFYRFINKVSLYRNSYLKNLAIAFIGVLFIQSLINILVCVNLIPSTFYGLMPFMSYGRSNIVTSFFALGLILSSYRRRNLKLESMKKSRGLLKNKLPIIEIKIRWRNN